jgi:large subunit ribosomal protein L27
MSHVKAGGSTKNLRDSNPKYLGVKIADGGITKVGAIIVRQRGTKILSGENTKLGKDHTIFATKIGKVVFGETRKKTFDGKIARKKIVKVV